MPMQTPGSYCVSACLALGALCALPVLSAPPATPVTSTMQAAQKIVLQHVVPSDVIKTLHWDQPANLPAGTTQVLAVPLQNALFVTATPAGFAKVQQIVKALDMAPRQVQAKFLLAFVSSADLKAALGSHQYATGLPAVRFLQTLTREKDISVFFTLTTTNDVGGSISCFYGPKKPVAFAFTPHINGDNSVILVLDAAVPEGAGKREIQTTRTIQSGDTMVLVKPPASLNAAENSLILFVIPTLVK